LGERDREKDRVEMVSKGNNLLQSHVCVLKPASVQLWAVNFFKQIMSQHSSLRAASGSGKKRNVLKRFERVELLGKRGLWKAGARVTGLPKTKPEE
jgi:small basic protein (TIGR04137 family)